MWTPEPCSIYINLRFSSAAVKHSLDFNITGAEQMILKTTHYNIKKKHRSSANKIVHV